MRSSIRPLPSGERADERSEVGRGAVGNDAESDCPSPLPSPRRGEGVRRALAEAAASFTFSETPCLDAELLMAHALGISREALLLSHLDAPTPDSFADLAARRLNHEPIAYIIGSRGFWTIDLQVG